MHKELTKWLIGVLPFGLGTPLVLSFSTGERVQGPGWIALLAILFGFGFIFWLGARVLWSEASAADADDELRAEAFWQGLVGMPNFPTVDHFDDQVAAAQAQGELPPHIPEEALSATQAALDAWVTAELLRRDTTPKFFLFLGSLVVGVPAIVLGSVFATQASVPSVAPVAVSVSFLEGQSLEDETGCTSDARFFLVEESWAQPKLQVIGDGCTAALWEPDRHSIFVHPLDAHD